MDSNETRRSYFCLALDTDQRSQAIELIQKTKAYFGMYKLGLQSLYSIGFSIIEDLKKHDRKIFLDVKLMDIPNTVAKACKALFHHGADIINVHTLGGVEMMMAAKQALQDESEKAAVPCPALIGVTVLTSLQETQLNEELNISTPLEHQVIHLAGLAKRAGLNGVVASAHETARIRQSFGPNFMVITPGIRLEHDKVNDQKRVATPQEALNNGSNCLVIGRSVTDAKDPEEAAYRMFQSVTLDRLV